MHVLIKPDPSAFYRNNQVFEINNGDNIFFGFKKKLAKLGVTVNTLDLDDGKKVDWIVFCDMPLFWHIAYIKKLLLNRNKSILFCFESPVISPLGQRKFFHRFFQSVYTWNDSVVDNEKVKKFFIPVFAPKVDVPKIAYKDKKLLCVINSNISVPYPLLMISPFKKVLYGERIKLIRFFEKEIPQEFSLYGRGWNGPMKFSLKENFFGFRAYPSYKGPIPRKLSEKLKVLARYKFNLCFENCVADGYISEKIFDCFRAKTVPIYLGAPNVEKYIPKDAFIDFRKFKDYPSLLQFLQSIDKRQYNNYIKNAQKLLHSQKFVDTWFEDGFLKVFLKAISFSK